MVVGVVGAAASQLRVLAVLQSGVRLVSMQSSKPRRSVPRPHTPLLTRVLCQQVTVCTVQQADRSVHARRQHAVVVTAHCGQQGGGRGGRGQAQQSVMGAAQHAGHPRLPCHTAQRRSPLTQVTGWCSSSVNRRPMRTSKRRTLPSTLPARISALHRSAAAATAAAGSAASKHGAEHDDSEQRGHLQCRS